MQDFLWNDVCCLSQRFAPESLNIAVSGRNKYSSARA